MLILSIPKLEPVGTCRINGQQAEYRVLPNHLEFRYEGQEVWDRRRILDSSENGDLTQLTCDNGAGSDGPYCVIQPAAVPTSDEHFYWLAINGASCAASSVPLPLTVRVIPTPEQLIGYRTRDSANQSSPRCLQLAKRGNQFIHLGAKSRRMANRCRRAGNTSHDVHILAHITIVSHIGHERLATITGINQQPWKDVVGSPENRPSVPECRRSALFQTTLRRHTDRPRRTS